MSFSFKERKKEIRKKKERNTNKHLPSSEIKKNVEEKRK